MPVVPAARAATGAPPPGLVVPKHPPLPSLVGPNICGRTTRPLTHLRAPPALVRAPVGRRTLMTALILPCTLPVAAFVGAPGGGRSRRAVALTTQVSPPALPVPPPIGAPVSCLSGSAICLSTLSASPSLQVTPSVGAPVTAPVGAPQTGATRRLKAAYRLVVPPALVGPRCAALVVSPMKSPTFWSRRRGGCASLPVNSSRPVVPLSPPVPLLLGQKFSGPCRRPVPPPV